MKRYIHSEREPDLIIEAIFEARFNNDDDSIAAATYKGINVPDGPLPPAEKKIAKNSPAYVNFESFVEGVLGLIEDTYELTIYYESGSPYGSFYYGALATNSDGSFILKFTASFRISTHEARRTKQSQMHKKEERDALKELTNTVSNNKLPRVIPVSIVVNDKFYKSYIDAIVDADTLIENAVNKMKKN